MHARGLKAPIAPEFLHMSAQDATNSVELDALPPNCPVCRTPMDPLSAASETAWAEPQRSYPLVLKVRNGWEAGLGVVITADVAMSMITARNSQNGGRSSVTVCETFVGCEDS